jgi:hypothetical protein
MLEEVAVVGSMAKAAAQAEQVVAVMLQLQEQVVMEIRVLLILEVEVEQIIRRAATYLIILEETAVRALLLFVMLKVMRRQIVQPGLLQLM